MSTHLVSSFLAASLEHYALASNHHVHPLDFYNLFCPCGMRALTTVYTHPAPLVKRVISDCIAAWPDTKSLDHLDTRSVVWSINKFPTTVLERIYMKPSQTTLPPDIVAKLTMSLASLEQALLDKDPLMPTHLRSSHQLLISYPETVHLLDDDEIARLISAAQIHAHIEIVKAAAPRATSKKKISADDL